MATPRRAPITLFADKYSLHADALAILLIEKNLAHERVIVDISNPPEDLLDVNPQLHLPTFFTREVVLYYLDVIMEYLDERYPHPPMLPVDPINRGRFRLILKRIIAEWYPHIEKMIAKAEADKKSVKAMNDLLLASNPLFEQKNFFQSNDFSMADCVLAPIFAWLRDFNVAIPAQSEAVQEYSMRVLARGSVRHILEKSNR